jgi:deoxyribose-phosphate aldolase
MLDHPTTRRAEGPAARRPSRPSRAIGEADEGAVTAVREQSDWNGKLREHWNRTGKVVGMKPAGGIRTAKDAIQYLVVVHETLGPDWLTPDRFRFGASSLVNDLLMQLEKEVTGAYADPDDFTLD